jgi:hypothetical protein
MPKIQWERLPKEKWAHLRSHAKERSVSLDDLLALAGSPARSSWPGKWRAAKGCDLAIPAVNRAPAQPICH